MDIFDTSTASLSPTGNDVDEMSDLFASLGDANITSPTTKNISASTTVAKKQQDILSDFTPLNGTNEGDDSDKKEGEKKKKKRKDTKKDQGDKKDRKKKKKKKSRKKRRKKRESEDADDSVVGDLLG